MPVFPKLIILIKQMVAFAEKKSPGKTRYFFLLNWNDSYKIGNGKNHFSGKALHTKFLIFQKS